MSGITLTITHDPAAFLQRAEPYLLEREAEHNVILGMATNLIRQPDPQRSQPYFAIIEDSGGVVSTAMWTPPHNLALSHTVSLDALPVLVRDLYQYQLATGETLPGVEGAPDTSHAFADLWKAQTGRAFHIELSMRAYQLVAVTPPTHVTGMMRRAVPEDRDIISKWVIAFHDEALPGAPSVDVERLLKLYFAPGTEEFRGYFIWEDEGRPVSLAAYTGPTPHGMRINTVYTPPEFRKRGYASGLVAGVSQYLLDSGRRFCFLFTDLKNPTSNKIYQDIGYRAVCDVERYMFET
jgi:predicted GNAT family acetyltransferase